MAKYDLSTNEIKYTKFAFIASIVLAVILLIVASVTGSNGDKVTAGVTGGLAGLFVVVACVSFYMLHQSKEYNPYNASTSQSSFTNQLPASLARMPQIQNRDLQNRPAIPPIRAK